MAHIVCVTDGGHGVEAVLVQRGMVYAQCFWWRYFPALLAGSWFFTGNDVGPKFYGDLVSRSSLDLGRLHVNGLLVELLCW